MSFRKEKKIIYSGYMPDNDTIITFNKCQMHFYVDTFALTPRTVFGLKCF